MLTWASQIPHVLAWRSHIIFSGLPDLILDCLAFSLLPTAFLTDKYITIHALPHFFMESNTFNFNQTSIMPVLTPRFFLENAIVIFLEF